MANELRLDDETKALLRQAQRIHVVESDWDPAREARDEKVRKVAQELSRELGVANVVDTD